MTDDKKLDEALETALAFKAEAKKEVKKVVAPVSDSIDLTDAEKADLEAQATKEVNAELKDKARKAYKEGVKQAIKKKKLFQAATNEDGEDLEVHRVNMASHSPFISLNGKRYYNNVSYRLTRGTAAVIKEAEYRGWLHDAEIHGLDMNDFLGRRKMNAVI